MTEMKSFKIAFSVSLAAVAIRFAHGMWKLSR